MSKAGKHSSEGDEYQLQVALHWCINVLTDVNIYYLAIDIVTIPSDPTIKKVEVDDIFIEYEDKKRVFIQAKKNETNYENWRLNNPTLKEEIKKAYQQYLNNNSDPKYKIYFYSASPFGKFQKAVKDINKDKLYSTYLLSAQNIKDTVNSISKIIQVKEEETFNFLLSIGFGSTRTIEEWNQNNLERLNLLVTKPTQAKYQLESILKNHQIGENDIPNKLTKKYLIKELEKEKLILTSKYKDTKILKEFKNASKIGRNKDYSINGEYLVQKDKQNIINKLESTNSSIIVTDKPGNGKSCLLDSIASHFENDSKYALLFIKGDEFSKVEDDKEFSKKYNMPKDIVGKIAVLSKSKKVIVIIDSLDVIALNKEYGTLKYFLSIIDRLEGLDNISLLVASRTFDLKYEPSLRDKKWSTKIELKEFSFEDDIIPLLNNLNIPYDKINTKLEKLLIIPQNLKLFVQIYDKIPYSNISTEYDLYNVPIKTNHLIKYSYSKR